MPILESQPTRRLIGSFKPTKTVLTLLAISVIIVLLGTGMSALNLTSSSPAPVWFFPFIAITLTIILCGVAIPVTIKGHQYAIFDVPSKTVSLTGGDFRKVSDINYAQLINAQQGRVLRLGFSEKDSFIIGTAGVGYLRTPKEDIEFIQSIIPDTSLPSSLEGVSVTKDEVRNWVDGMVNPRF